MLHSQAHKSFTAASIALGGEFPDLTPIPSKPAHKLLIVLLSLGFGGNKNGLDSSVFTFRENH